ncbi:MAG: 6,7-dimethyl-8-ribityllumazine synthase [Verrucomicrobiota bacterium]
MKYKIAIVASRFNDAHVNGLIDAALKLLKSHSVDIVRVPGAFEIPLAVQRVIRKKKPQAVIALGVIWRGKTLHAELLARSVTDALLRVSLEHDVPVIHQVLTVKNEKDAKERCFGKLNRGKEAAEVALQMLAGETDHE